jgi:UDP-N-acetylmuramoylalanine--D-glutamate ligase
LTRVAVLGLAATGRATAACLAAEGASVSVLDDAPEPADGAADGALASLRAAGVELHFAPDPAAADAIVDAAELVVPSPGVRPDHRLLRRAAASGTAVRSEIDLAAERCTAPLVAVTGTNGKTTTTELLAAMLRAGARDVVVGGNIGTPLISVAATRCDAVVAEVSSFQLHFTTSAFHPRVAVLLNVADDHLDWHGTLEAYTSDKAKVFAHQGPGDVLVVNDDDPAVVRISRDARSVLEHVTLAGASGTYHSDGHALRMPDGAPIIAIDELPRALPHDLTNALCAAAAARACDVDAIAMADALRVYATLPHRVQLIGENCGVRYYDDSKATNPHAAVRAVRAFESVVLLAGGLNKGLDLSALTEVDDHIRAVVAFGDAGDEVAAAFAGRRPVTRAQTMHDAVVAARDAARPGDVVLLSPGCASFDMYPGGYTERGDDFAAEVHGLYANAGGGSPSGRAPQASGGGDSPSGREPQASGGGDSPSGREPQASGGGGSPSGREPQASGGGGSPSGREPQASGGGGARR